MKHTWWSPIICKSCNSKLHFNKKEWYKIIAPMCILTIFCLLVIWLPEPIRKLKYFILLIGTFIILVIGAFIKFLVDIKSIKLEIK